MRSAMLTLLIGLVPATLAVTQQPPAGDPARQQPDDPQETPDPFDDAEGRTDLFGRRTFEERAALHDELIIGAWRLAAYHDIQNVYNPDSVVGYALFVDGYLSIELHTSVADSLGRAADFMMSGTFQYTWDDAARLRLSALIGTTNMTFDEEILFMPPGSAREYAIEVDETGLIMTRLDDVGGSAGARFVFQRMENSSPKARLKRDFFGRIIPADEDEKDSSRRPVRVPLDDTRRPRR